jgi:hypothetical protein
VAQNVAGMLADAPEHWPEFTPARGCLSVNQTELKSALKFAGLKPAEVNATIERCGNRLPPTLEFVRRSA